MPTIILKINVYFKKFLKNLQDTQEIIQCLGFEGFPSG